MKFRNLISFFVVVSLIFFNIQTNIGISLPISVSQGLNIDDMEILDSQMRIEREDNKFITVIGVSYIFGNTGVVFIIFIIPIE